MPMLNSELSKEQLPNVQQALDRLFPLERRAERLVVADKDSSGRPVRYFRYMNVKAFRRLISEGRLDRATYDQSSVYETAEHTLKDFCRRIVERGLGDASEDYEEIYDLSTEELIERVFSTDATATQQALHEERWDDLRGLIARYVPRDMLFRCVAGGMGRKLVPWLSVSVGGPIQGSLCHRADWNLHRVYVECVIPESRVDMHPYVSDPKAQPIEGEKEVFVSEIILDDIVSCVITNEAYSERMIRGTDSNIATHALIPNPDVLYPSDVERWRWDTCTVDYVPVSLLKRRGYPSV